MADVITITINGNASGLVGAATQAQGALGRLEGTATKAGGVLSSVFGGVGMGVGIKAFEALTSGMRGAIDTAIGFNSKLEQSTIAFTSMLGSAEKAQAFLAEMKQFAATTPFEFPDLLQASKQMMAFGFEAKEVRPLLTAVGSAAAAMGTGRSGVDSITKALGQMKAATVVQAGELNQLTEQGVPAFQILADAMGISTGEVKKLASEGKIASDVFIEAFQVWANANYGDMMAKQALTFEGAVSNIKDSLTFAVSEAFKPFFEVISAGAVELSKFVQGETFSDWARTVAATTREAFRQIGDAWRTLGQAFSGDWEPSAVIDPFVNAVGLLGLTFRRMYDTVAPLVTQLGEIFQRVMDGEIRAAVDQFLALVGTVASELAPILAGWGQAFIDWVAPMIPPFLAAVADIGLQLLTWIGAQIPPIAAQLLLWGAEFVAWVAPQIPPLLAALADLGTQMLAWISAQIPIWTQNLLLWGQEFVAWVGPQIPVLLSELGKLSLQMLDWMIAQVPGITASLVEWGILFGAWVLTTAIPELIKALPGVYQTIVDWIASALLELGPRLLAFGAALIEGIVTGIKNAAARLAPDVSSAIGGMLPAWAGGTSSSGGGGTGDYDAQAIAAAQKYGLQDPTGFAAQLRQESGNYDPEVVSGRRRSSAGATGIAQFMPGTAARYGVDPTDAAASIDAAARYMADLQRETGSQSEAAARYYGASSANSADGRYYLNAIETQRRNVRMPTPNVPQVSQFALGLAPDEALAACGPAALSWFMNQTGRTPSGTEARQLAASAGWDASRGMYGPAAFGRALTSAGISNVVDTSPMSGEVASLAAAGTPFAISTSGYTDEFGQSRPGHYFQVQGGSLEGLNVGLSGTALKGGSSIMSLDQIQAMTGPMNALITLSGQMGDALTTAGVQGGQAFDGLLTSVTTLADGSKISITQMGETITATVTDAAGNVVASYGTMAATVPEQFATMGQASLQSVTDLGAGILTTMTDSSGSTIATVTDMHGQVTSQYATLANGVNLTMGDMAAGVMTTTTDMGDGMVTTVQDANGNMISTVTDAAGNVTSQYTSMASQSGDAVTGMANVSREQFGNVVKAAGGIPPAIDAVNEAFDNISTPDFRDTVKQFGEASKAAREYAKRVKEAAEATESLPGRKGGEKGGDKDRDDNPFAKRHGGGDVLAGVPYRVGRTGAEETFISQVAGHVYTTGQLQPYGGYSGPTAKEIAAELAAVLPRGSTYVLNGVHPESVFSEADRRARVDALMYRIGG